MLFKTNKNKLYILFLSTLILFNSNKMIFPISCNASEPPTIETHSDVYVYKYRINNKTGNVQKRLWNDSKKVWAEPYWHDV
mgnify:CR=1 FL=1